MTGHLNPVPVTMLMPDFTDPAAVPFADAVARTPATERSHVAQVERARVDGFAAGMAAARRDLAAEADATATRVADGLAQLVAAAQDAAADAVSSQASEMAQAAWQLAAWGLGRELVADPSALTAAVDEALAEFDAAVEVAVYAHPTAIDVLAPWATAHAPTPLRVVPDPSLLPGELRVSTTTGGRIEATIAEIGRRALARLVSTAAAADAPTEPTSVPTGEDR